MTDATRNAIELAKRIHGGTRGELGRDRAEDSMTIVDFARAIVELSRPNKIDQARVEAADWNRASGDVECSHCKRPYYGHATVQGFEWLHRLCDGRFVKL
jgi:hypothetical protein